MATLELSRLAHEIRRGRPWISVINLTSCCIMKSPVDAKACAAIPSGNFVPQDMSHTKPCTD
jgi:hypothetical protein